MVGDYENAVRRNYLLVISYALLIIRHHKAGKAITASREFTVRLDESLDQGSHLKDKFLRLDDACICIYQYTVMVHIALE